MNHPYIESVLALYFSVLARRPETPDRTQRPFGKIRSDFDRALLAGNVKERKGLLKSCSPLGESMPNSTNASKFVG